MKMQASDKKGAVAYALRKLDNLSFVTLDRQRSPPDIPGRRRMQVQRLRKFSNDKYNPLVDLS